MTDSKFRLNAFWEKQSLNLTLKANNIADDILIFPQKIGFDIPHTNCQFAWNIHYENTPIQMYRKFHLQKLKIFR